MSRPTFTAAANTLWMLACRRSLRHFRNSLGHVAATQASVLQDIFSANKHCDFGRQHGFDTIRNVEDFRERVPLAEYEDVHPWVNRICAGERGVLTTEPVLLLEPTSGSVSGRKLIPYTATLQRQFQNGINAWIADLFAARPKLRHGRSYWSVSPPTSPESTAGGLPIGFADDTQYLGPLSRLAARRVLAVPPNTMRDVSQEDASHRTLLQLLTVPDLTLISVWSPTFLTTLMRCLSDHRERFVTDLSQFFPTKTADRVIRILSSTNDTQQAVKKLWPQLSLISCWADGSAGHGLPEVRSMFPDVEIQRKGLLSTEAFVSLPLVGHRGSLLSLRSHFFEFQPEGSPDEDTLLADQLRAGECYRVIVTTGGGLYRYRTHDVVEVIGHEQQCPQIQFIGRNNHTSDLVGEKLTDAFVASAINRVAHRVHLQSTFAMLTPQPNQRGYCLLLDLPLSARCESKSSDIAAELDAELSENPWYEHARRNGQLEPVEVRMSDVEHGWSDHFQSQCLAGGIRRGDIKPTALDTRGMMATVVDLASP